MTMCSENSTPPYAGSTEQRGLLRREFLGSFARLNLFGPMLLGLLAGSQSGCQFWSEPAATTKNGLRLGTLRSAPGGMGLLVAVVTLRPDQSEELEPLWADWDSQAIGLLQRRVWDENGMRVAVAPNQLPGPLLRVLESEPETGETNPALRRISAESPLSSTGDRTAWRLTLREGQPKLVGMTPVYPEASWTIRQPSGVTAGAGEQVTGLIQVTANPSSEGQVRLTLRPLLRHGKPLTRVGVLDSSLALQTSQTENLLDPLRIDVDLRTGQTLVAGLASVPAELGVLLFGTPDVDGLERLLLLRLIHSPGESET
jgi:hypothetical protein